MAALDAEDKDDKKGQLPPGDDSDANITDPNEIPEPKKHKETPGQRKA